MIPFPPITISIILLTLIILFFFKKPFTFPRKVVSVFLLIVGIITCIRLIEIDFSIRQIAFPDFLYKIHSYPFLYGPFIYLYMKLEISKKNIFRKSFLLHFLPFVLFTLMVFVFPKYMNLSSANPFEDKAKFDNEISRSFSEPNRLPPPSFFINMYDILEHKPDMTIVKQKLTAADCFYYISMLLSFIIYSMLMIRLQYKHINDHKNITSRDKNKNQGYFKYKFITLCFICSYLSVFIFMFATYGRLHPAFSRMIPDGVRAFFIFVFCFFIIQGLDIPKDSCNEDYIDNNDNGKRYVRSGLKDEMKNNYLSMLESYMQTEKPYLNNDLTIDDVSEKLGISRHYLTQTINECLNKNFFTYINEYRISEAQKMLADRNYTNHTIIRIAYTSGFNTKAGFNLIFKKYTGVTPTEYREKSKLVKV